MNDCCLLALARTPVGVEYPFGSEPDICGPCWNNGFRTAATALGTVRRAGKPCPDHTGPTGAAAEFSGRDAFDPTPWVLDVVGSFFKANNWLSVEQDPPMDVFICDGYDPRHGVWVKDLRTGVARNISERAIDVNFHRLKPRTGPEAVLLRQDPYYVLAVSLHL